MQREVTGSGGIEMLPRLFMPRGGRGKLLQGQTDGVHLGVQGLPLRAEPLGTMIRCDCRQLRRERVTQPLLLGFSFVDLRLLERRC